MYRAREEQFKMAEIELAAKTEHVLYVEIIDF
jgi:hypothetical protein